MGVVFGLGAGLSLCFFLESSHFIKLPAKIYYIEYLPVLVDYKDVFVICLLGLGMSLFFSLAPAIRAAKIKEAQALRYE